MRLRTKFIFHFSGLVIVIMTAIMAYVVSHQGRVLKEQAEKLVSAIARNVAAASTNSLLVYDMIELDQDAGQIAEIDDVLFVWIFDDENRLLGSNSRTLSDSETGTLEGGPGAAYRRQDSTGVDARVAILAQERRDFFGAVHALDVECPVSYMNESGQARRIGTVRLGFSLDPIYREITAMRWSLGLIWIAALCVAVVVSTLLARRVTRPIERVAVGAQLYAAGRLDHRIEIDAKDEIAALADNLNEMAVEIRGSIATIEDLNRNLEQKVRDRTQELEKTNLHLESALVKLRDTQSQLVQTEKMASLGQLLAGVTHEINNPLNFISNGVAPLRETVDDLKDLVTRFDQMESIGEEDRAVIETYKNEIGYDEAVESLDELIDVIRDGAKRACSIVGDLRTFSRHDEAEFKRANLHDGIDKTLALMRTDFSDRIEVVREYGDIAPFDYRPAPMNQVFLNILSNAVQAIEGPGRIVIRTMIENEHAVVSITDSGRGIAPEHIGRVFEPFFTTKDVGSGTGLGLAISYTIVQQHGGRIEVESRAGDGTTFTVRIPFATACHAIGPAIGDCSELYPTGKRPDVGEST